MSGWEKVSFPRCIHMNPVSRNAITAINIQPAGPVDLRVTNPKVVNVVIHESRSDTASTCRAGIGLAGGAAGRKPGSDLTDIPAACSRSSAGE